MDRGVQSLATLQSLFAFVIGPTVLELLVVCGVFLQINTPLIALSTLLSVIAYAFFSYYITNWRTTVRRAMIEADNQLSDKATDSLLNFETVKSFGAEPIEVKRYTDLALAYQKTVLKTQFSLG